MLARRGPRSVATGRRVEPRERGPREREPPRGIAGSAPRGRMTAWPPHDCVATGRGAAGRA